MGLADSDFMIRDFDDIRALLRNTYIFGCYTKDDYVNGFAGKKISKRKIEKEQSRLKQFLPADFFLERRENRKVLKYCKYDLIDNADNYLAETYRNKSFTVLDILSYLLVQEILETEGEVQLQQLLDAIPEEVTVFNKDNLRIKLNELIDKDLLYCRKEGRNVVYGMKEDVFKEFSNEELVSLLTYIDFMKRTSAFEMPFYFLQRKIRLYLQYEREYSISEKSFFRYKFNHIFNTLDNEVLMDLLKSINQNGLVSLMMELKERPIVVKPLKIIHDASSGRQFVYCYCINAFHPYKVFRIDRILEVNPFDDKNTIVDEIVFDEEKLNKCWCISGIEDDVVEVVIEFHFDEIKEGYIYRRIQREGHGGTLERIEAGVYKFTINVGDPKELVPWIRSFGEKAKVISSGTTFIEKDIYENWMEALRKYEAF